jgi:DNA-binding CsgD family transcriptional regulator
MVRTCNLLPRIIRRGGGSAATPRKAQIASLSVQGMSAARIARWRWPAGLGYGT